MQSDADPFASVQTETKVLRDAAIPDVVPPTLTERFLAAVEKKYGPLPQKPPLTGAGIQAQCRWCQGRGCLACDAAKDCEYARQFPNGAAPLATFRRDDPEDRQLLKDAFCQAERVEDIPQRLTDAVTQQERLATADREDLP